MLMTKLQKRLAKEESGFTLIELLIVLVIIGVLLAIAVPSYLGFKDRANKSAAQANVRSAIPAVEAWYADHGSYSGMTPALLRASYDAGLKVSVQAATATGYCVYNTQGGSFVYKKAGPSQNIVAGACP